MPDLFATKFQLWTMVAAAVLFSAAVYLTRARFRRAAGALIAFLAFSLLNMLWDRVANQSNWWEYPLQAGPLAPVATYLASDLVWGGVFGLVGWRIQRRFGSLVLAAFIFLLSVAGTVRDHLIASRTQVIVFGPAPFSTIADFACWATLLVIAQLIMRAVSGPATADGLARRFVHEV
jgi:hypothetical protein